MKNSKIQLCLAHENFCESVKLNYTSHTIYGLKHISSEDTPDLRLDNLIKTLRKNTEQCKLRRHKLAPQIAFLSRYGISFEKLVAVEDRSLIFGISPERTLVSQRILTEEIYLDLFCQEFGYERVAVSTELTGNSLPVNIKIKKDKKIKNCILKNSKNQIVVVPKSFDINFLMSGGAQRHCTKLQLASSAEFKLLIFKYKSEKIPILLKNNLRNELKHINF